MPSSSGPGAEQRVRLVVLFGGQSAEHDVSRVTARHVLGALDRGRYEIVPVGITPEGSWVMAEKAAELLAHGDAGALDGLGDTVAADGPAVDALPLLAGAPTDGLAPAADGVQVVVLPLLHGPMGEDGTVQGLLETAGVAYVGSGVLGSALAMDKIAAKQQAFALGLPQAAWRGLHRDEILGPTSPVAGPAAAVSDDVVAALVEQLGLPLFVKPANMGSSIGVAKAADRAEVAAALLGALAHDEWVVVEEAVTGREIEVAVLGHTTSPRASVPGEVVPGAEFYSYDDKYFDGVAELRIPAPLPAAVADEVRALACRAFTGLRAEGLARVDFFYEADGRGLLLNELNTIPGFTPISMFPRLWQASGLTYRALLDELIALGIERHERRRGGAR
jgi:D-alanine-D-alanine ligase